MPILEMDTHMIDVKNLTFTYAKTDTLALTGLNFAVERGEIFGFLGPRLALIPPRPALLARCCRQLRDRNRKITILRYPLVP
jgi:hypothetical protein